MHCMPHLNVDIIDSRGTVSSAREQRQPSSVPFLYVGIYAIPDLEEEIVIGTSSCLAFFSYSSFV